MASPFIEVVTRCYRRPKMLAHNQASLRLQTYNNWIQTLLPDTIGRGVGWAQENLGMNASNFVGQYIWILDDDDYCIHSTLFEELSNIVAQYAYDVVMVRFDHLELGILPNDENWKNHNLVLGGVGCSAIITKREIFQHHSTAWIPGEYTSDFNFIESVFNSNPSVYWHDVVAGRIQRRSIGKPEE